MAMYARATPLVLTLVLLVIISTGVSVPTATAQQADSGDRDALVALYNDTDGANWGNNTGWLTAAPIGEWHGVDVDLGGRVVRLSLGFNELTGPIPAELGSLSNLERLDLSFNNLTGPIPAELGGLSNLESLSLSNNRLTGIPPELGSLSNLESLSLSSNRLTEIPPELGSLSNLKSLYLSSNELTGIPAELGSLSNLERLDLSFNNLTGPIPAELGGLSNLESLSLSNNRLTGIPPELGSLSNLESLSLSSNRLTEIPPELGSLSNLKSLYLSSNELTGIPAELGSLSNLESLSLGFNELTGPIPAELGSLSNLERLDLSFNNLTGPIPAELGGLSNLESLSLSSNRLTGIPPELGSLSNLESLSLSSNRLTGIPPELGSLSNLKSLYLSSNELTGIPPELGSLSNLESLSLGFNELTGPIPAELGSLSNLERLDLSFNNLTGPIPAELGGLSNLESLYLSNNRLTGCIPAGLRDVENNDLDRLGLPYCSRVTGPSAPQNLTATANEATQIDLSWSAPSVGGSPITGYRIEVSTDRTAWTDLVANTGSTNTSYSHTGLTAGSIRYYRVSAIDSEGTGRPSNVASATTTTAPSDPCLEVESLGSLTAPVTRIGAWADDCDSEARTGSYARYYSFTLNQTGQVEINLTSPVDTYLALREGDGRDGTTEDSNDNVGSRNFNSSINRVLAAGTYTVEATTYFVRQTGSFTLSVRPLQGMEDLGPLTRSVDRSNSAWTSDYMSTQRMMDSYARSYTFILTAETHVVINLTSPEDPYLFLLDTNGAVVHENDNVTTRNLNSRIDQTLAAGTYTIEATTYFPARMGTFHLSIGYFGAPGN